MCINWHDEMTPPTQSNEVLGRYQSALFYDEDNATQSLRSNKHAFVHSPDLCINISSHSNQHYPLSDFVSKDGKAPASQF